MNAPDPYTPHRKAPVVVFLIVATVAVSGYFMGILQNKTYSEEGQIAARYAVRGPAGNGDLARPSRAVAEIQEYWEMADRQLQPNASWANTLKNLPPPPPPSSAPPEAMTDAERRAAITQRMARRAYDGAPPVVPHPIAERTAASCLACHGQDTMVDGLLVPKMSHQEYTSCFQCHASNPAGGLRWNTAQFGLKVENRFEGKSPAGQAAPAAYEGAPAPIPHTTWMRDDCMSCHGPGRPEAIVTPHPERQSCTQCHAPNAELDQRAFRTAADRVRESQTLLPSP